MTEPLTCATCGKKTISKVIVKKYCSPKCRMLAWARREIEKKSKRGHKTLAAFLAFWALACPSVSAETWIATAYCACYICTDKTSSNPAYGITASGNPAQEGRTVAVNWLPFGTRLNLNGHIYRVEDRGAEFHFGSRSHPKKRVDIFFSTHPKALKFGRRKVNVDVIK